ncbi:MAG: hypothetical protein Greene041619_161 [Candidatus Peregrinibacteria bacterium Greene0416_19]|nr:MAG: hypothetical protein Greene041619_161 [Candidatus Peregrinibacteria bacterium Greene0416_19]
MHTAMTSPAGALHSQILRVPTVLIDWTHVVPAHQTADTQTNTALLLNWVRSHPGGSHVHVVLRRFGLAAEGRQLRNSLQALGCTVTTRFDR